MSRTTTNLGLTAVTNSETIGDFSDAMNASGGNLDIIDGKMGAVGATSLQAQITALNSNMTNVTTGQVVVNSTKVTSGTLDITSCRKTGKFVSVAARVHSITDGTVTATGVFFTIPEGFRPVATTYGYAYLNIDGSFVPIFASIGTNGEVQINYTGSKSTTQVFFCASYVV